MAKIIGAHTIIYSKNPEADRAQLRDVFKFTHVDVGRGWLIFGLPPSEVAIHPSEGETHSEFYLMIDDARAFAAELKAKGIACSAVGTRPYGHILQVTMPGGGTLDVYQPLHARPEPMA